MRQAALRLGERFERRLGLEAPFDDPRTPIALRDRNQELLRGGEALAARRRQVEPNAHTLVVVLEQMTADG